MTGGGNRGLDEAAAEYDRAVRNLAIIRGQVARLAEMERVALARVEATEAILVPLAARSARENPGP